jgi:CheY-like chemotaxis protein
MTTAVESDARLGRAVPSCSAWTTTRPCPVPWPATCGRRYGNAYRVLRATSGNEALEALRELKLRGEQVAVLLADYRMPENGIESAMDLYPGRDGRS